MYGEEKISQAVDFLQRRITSEFEYPFKVAYEEGTIVFRYRDGDKECCAKMKEAEKMINLICDGSCKEIEEEIARLYEALRTAVGAREKAMFREDADYEAAKKDLILRPLNYGQVEKELTDVPHFKIGEIALVLYTVVAKNRDDFYTAKVHRKQLEKYGKGEKDILMDALRNTEQMFQPRLYSVDDLLGWLGKTPDSGVFMGEEVHREIDKSTRGYILTNTLEINGAAVAFYPGVAEKIAEIMDDDFYLAFTSIHEAQVHAAAMIEPEVIRLSLQDTNRRCNRREEVLTNHVYFFNREKKSFGVIENGTIQPLSWEMGKAG